MGRKFDEVQQELHRVPYKVVEAANGDALHRPPKGGETKTYSPPKFSGMILAKLKADAESKSRRENHPGGHHRARLFQRLATHRHQGRG